MDYEHVKKQLGYGIQTESKDNAIKALEQLQAKVAELKAECDDIKQVQFPRKLEAVAVGWKKQLAAAQEECEFQRNAHKQAEELMLEQSNQLAASQAYAEQLRKAERERCAKVCEKLRHPDGFSSENDDWCAGTDHCAAAIRAMKDE